MNQTNPTPKLRKLALRSETVAIVACSQLTPRRDGATNSTSECCGGGSTAG